MCQDNIPHTTSSLTCVYRQAESTLPNSDRWNSSEQLIWGEVSSVGDESFDLWAPERTTYLNSRGRYDLAACPCICACVWGGVDDALKKNAVSGLALQFLRVRVPRSPWSSLSPAPRSLPPSVLSWSFCKYHKAPLCPVCWLCLSCVKVQNCACCPTHPVEIYKTRLKWRKQPSAARTRRHGKITEGEIRQELWAFSTDGASSRRWRCALFKKTWHKMDKCVCVCVLLICLILLFEWIQIHLKYKYNRYYYIKVTTWITDSFIFDYRLIWSDYSDWKIVSSL